MMHIYYAEMLKCKLKIGFLLILYEILKWTLKIVNLICYALMLVKNQLFCIFYYDEMLQYMLKKYYFADFILKNIACFHSICNNCNIWINPM